MISIAIIENEDQYGSALSAMLRISPGISLAGVWSDGKSAMKHIRSIVPDIVLIGNGLPGVNENELIWKLKNINPSIVFIVISRFEDDEHVFDALKAGASGYLLKKDGPEAILHGIHEVMMGGVPMNGMIARKVISSFHETSSINRNSSLTFREKEVFNLLSTGKLYKEIAAKLVISLATTKKHVSHIYLKLEVENRTEAINKWHLCMGR